MEAKPECFPRVAKTEHRRTRSGRRRGATMLELVAVPCPEFLNARGMDAEPEAQRRGSFEGNDDS